MLKQAPKHDFKSQKPRLLRLVSKPKNRRDCATLTRYRPAPRNFNPPLHGADKPCLVGVDSSRGYILLSEVSASAFSLGLELKPRWLV